MERKQRGMKNRKRKGDEIKEKRRERYISSKGQARPYPETPSPGLVSGSAQESEDIVKGTWKSRRLQPHRKDPREDLELLQPHGRFYPAHLDTAVPAS